MSDLINRQAAMDGINEYMVGKRCDTDGTMMARLINELVIKQLPTIQPKRGKWIDLRIKEEVYGEMYKCSVCGDFDFGGCFCPNCGADMRSDDMREATT